MKEWDAEFHLRRAGKEATDKKVADVLRLSDGVTNFGRHTKSDNYLNSAVLLHFISRRHAEIVCEHTDSGKQFVLVDHSVNGTYINDYRVNGRTALKEGDLVVFGHTNGKHVLPGVYAPQPQSEFKFRFERILDKKYTPVKSETQKGSIDHQSPGRCKQERHRHGSTMSSPASSTDSVLPRLEGRGSDDLDRCTVTPDTVLELPTERSSTPKDQQHLPDLNSAIVLTPSSRATDVPSKSPNSPQMPALKPNRRRNCTMTSGKVGVASPEQSPNHVSPSKAALVLSIRNSSIGSLSTLDLNGTLHQDSRDSLSRTQSFSDPGSPVIPILNGTGSVQKDPSRAGTQDTVNSCTVENSLKIGSQNMTDNLKADALKDISNTCTSEQCSAKVAVSCVSTEVRQTGDQPSKPDSAAHIPQELAFENSPQSFQFEGEVFRETVEIAVKDEVSGESMSQEDIFSGYVDPSRQSTVSTAWPQQPSVINQHNPTSGEQEKPEVKKVRGQKSKQGATSHKGSSKKRSKAVALETKPAKKCKKDESDEDSDADNYNLSKYTRWHYAGDPCSAIDCSRPCEDNVSWVQCDQCDNWYHTVCAGCDYDAVKNDSVHFFCGCL